MSSTSEFAAVLTTVAEEIRHRILEDRANHLPDPLEETHTQNLLSRLARLTRTTDLAVVAREVPKKAEARLLGADVVLWVVGDGGTAALHLQCKRLFPDDAYHDLGHVNKTGRQVDLLISGAKRLGAGAAYMFYNGLQDDQPADSACCLLDFSPDRNGVSLAVAKSIEPHVGAPKRSLGRAAIESLCTPAVCLARCCRRTLPNQEDDLADVVRSWYLHQTDEALDVVDVTGVPKYARGLFDDLAFALNRARWEFEDDGDDAEYDPQTQDRLLADPEFADGTTLAVAVAPTPR